MVGLWCSVKNYFNFSTCLRVFIIRCWKETNGSVQCVSEEMAPDSLLPSSQRGWEGDGKNGLQAENSGSINFP